MGTLLFLGRKKEKRGTERERGERDTNRWTEAERKRKKKGKFNTEGNKISL